MLGVVFHRREIAWFRCRPLGQSVASFLAALIRSLVKRSTLLAHSHKAEEADYGDNDADDEQSELNDFGAVTPRTMSMTPPDRKARETILFINVA